MHYWRHTHTKIHVYNLRNATTAVLKTKKLNCESTRGGSEMAIVRCNKGIQKLTKTALSRTSWETFSLICTAEPSLFKPRVNFLSILLLPTLSFRDQANKLLLLLARSPVHLPLFLFLCENRRKFKNRERDTHTHTHRQSGCAADCAVDVAASDD